MFITETHHPQLLGADCYRCEDHFAVECEQVFGGTWNFVGTTHQWPTDGSYITTKMFGRPIIIWKRSGEYQTFLNVCPHRYATLTDQPTGQCDRLVCQYHGWEFDESGDTRKIPDAVNFKPLKKGVLGLTAFSTEVIGNLVFVNFSEDPTPIEEFFGQHLDFINEFYGGPRPLMLNIEQSHDANWKIIVENALESYHISMVHSKTLGTSATAEACTHEIYDDGSKFIEDMSMRTNGPAKMALRVLEFLKFPHSKNFQHLLLYPSGMLTSVPPFSLVQWVTPVSATKTISRWSILGFKTDPTTIQQRIMHPFLKNYAKKFFPALLGEDRQIQEAVQRGLQSPQLPRGGLISAREERIFHFQKMIAEITGVETVEE